uniref:serine/threonine-protein phosphatase CPPED1-like n=1 Tax=Styela clava TaxID=7725 RepID=UPI00193ABB2C|nr:serine/threonine-protein phosphatase CPPED1-like [Styela clava]
MMKLVHQLYLTVLACVLQQSNSQLLKAKNREVVGFTKSDQGKWIAPYTFIQGADPQPGLIDQITGGDGTVWVEDIRRLNKAVSDIDDIQNKPKFFFISGDLVNAFPGVEPYRQQQIDDVNESLANMQIPTMVISGNHDLLNTPTRNSIEEFKQIWGDDYYKFYCGGVLYIALNSQYFYDSSEVQDLAQAQSDWLKNELQQAKSDEDLDNIVILMHIPIFSKHGDEDDDYFNIPRSLRMDLLDEFMEAGVKIVFSGHYHRNSGGKWSNLVNGTNLTIESVVNSAIGAQLGEDKSGLRVVNVKSKDITHKYYTLDELPNVLNRGLEL